MVDFRSIRYDWAYLRWRYCGFSFLQEIVISKTDGERLGMHIKGGLNGQRGNPIDPTDEGVFVSKINSIGAARRDGRLKVNYCLDFSFTAYFSCFYCYLVTLDRVESLAKANARLRIRIVGNLSMLCHFLLLYTLFSTSLWYFLM